MGHQTTPGAGPSAAVAGKLTAAQIETLKRWVAEGAPYKKHWSFEAPVKAVVPAATARAGSVTRSVHFKAPHR